MSDPTNANQDVVVSDPNDRVSQALRHARHETGLKDVFSFGLGRAWSVLQVFGTVFAAVCTQMSPEPNTGIQQEAAE